MAKCEFCDKGVVFGIQVSHSHRRQCLTSGESSDHNNIHCIKQQL